METREAVQLGVVLLFPLSLLIVLLAGVARQHGRTRRQTAFAIFGIAACLVGVVATGLALNAWRGGPLFDFDRDSFSLGSIQGPDILGLLVCATLLVIGLRISKWLAGAGPSAPRDAEPVEQGDESE
ncbi:MAG: hypothetical protein FJX75_26825 [Armatimonadetes bacterium]|nr:hypothetical protein [Armatimonadota bacterium]